MGSVITPKPLYTVQGLVQWCYSKPAGLYEDICSAIGDFNLFYFWGRAYDRRKGIPRFRA
ncbi:MAG: hypothetical protein AB1553_15625 [Nitrospirota bacterium]